MSSVRFALLSDVHSNLPALEAVAARIETGGYDAIYCLGDLGGYAAHPNEVIELLKAMRCPTVMGNYDENVGFGGDDCGCGYTNEFPIRMGNVSFSWTCAHTSDASKAYLRALPRQIRFEANGCDVVLCHGSPRVINESLDKDAPETLLREFLPGGASDAHANIICCAHTHIPYHRVVDGTHFINTGTVGRPHGGETRAGYMELTIDGNGDVATEYIYVGYDVEKTAMALIAAGLPEYFAHYLRHGGRVPVELQR